MKKIFFVIIWLMFILSLVSCGEEKNQNIDMKNVNVVKSVDSNIDIEPYPNKEEKLYCYLFLELDNGLSNVAVKCSIVEKDENFDPIKVEYNGCIYIKVLNEDGKSKWVKG